ncbi:hypothetical protein CISIN_1g018989mg [Citrus sinensis]|uniref:Fe2OG dioxygenase domain-containing protein n=1 Tax=Citrus sinensis TaxID=2711 RepID=A0A067G1L9_CITSI|nr:hypothetical protein CISIN_1g018989mg [Citrus sinensis]
MDMAKATSVSKTIEQMVTHSEQPSSGFIVKETKFGSIESSPPLGPFPVIDMSLFSSQEHVGTELEKLKSSLSSAGCFQVVGHGMSDSFLDRVREVAVEFFQLPAEEKQKHARAVNEIEGEILNEYAMKLKTVTEVLSKAIAKSLNLEEYSFLNQFGDQALMQVRFNFYPPCSRPDLVHGVKPHTDRSGITILLQDREVEGLQIRVDGKWYRVPVIPHALVVNLGDQMQIMTNGIYKSPMHRVVTNTEKLRISIAAFTEPEPENEIGPVDQLIDEQRPKLYRNVRNYGAINYECYQKGLVALDTVRA